MEEIHSKQHLTQEEQACHDHFNKTYKRQDDGRFVVQLPLKDNSAQLGESYSTARRRLLSLEKKLNGHPDLKQQYTSFMQEYEDLGHMIHILKDSDEALLDGDCVNAYYLPHHAVSKEENDTTRLRVVFDASAKTSTGLSLNDVQLVGPTIQQDLFSIMLRFR